MTDRAGGEQPRKVLDDGLAFFGAVTASVSHELNNVISIIDQTAGLLQDMIAAENKGIPINIARLSAAVDSVQHQTERGLAIIGRLNRFAHSADEPRVEFDVAEVLENLVELSRRLAALKYAGLEFECSPARATMVGNPFFVQAVVFLSIRAALAGIQRDDTIRVSARSEDDGLLVRLESPREIDTGHRDMAALRFIAGHIHARVGVTSEEQRALVDMKFAGGGGNATSR